MREIIEGESDQLKIVEGLTCYSMLLHWVAGKRAWSH
jgi:hypothetical protein